MSPLLETALSTTLLAMLAGVVFMAVISYIGNAPSFAVKSIAGSQGVRRRCFFGYML